MINKEHNIKITFNKDIGFNSLKSIILKGLKKELGEGEILNVYIEELLYKSQKEDLKKSFLEGLK